MAREGHINAAGGFLRALKQPSGPGGQGVGAPTLPVRELLMLLSERPRSSSEIATELVVSDAVVTRAIENLQGLGLVALKAIGEEDVADLTDLGRDVADQQRAG